MDKKIALITGGNRGIGASISKKLASDGYYVCINCRNKHSGISLLEDILSCGGEGEIVEFDVAVGEQLNEALRTFKFKQLDVLVNNAGILKDNLIYQIGVDDWKQVLKTNYFGALAVHNAFWEKLKAAKSATVINLCSISGIRPRKGQLAYAVSKAMLIEWTKQMSSGEHRDRIQYYSISPGPVTTELIKQSSWYKDSKSFQRIPLGRYAEPDEIATFIAFLASHNHVLKNGSNIIMDGGFTQTIKEQ
ncbi:SDR family NAD(P)-dependent oxidoreductase [Pelosinus baikalensis]|uniref:SDR family oxidoreductase n=1 Tax=Pelosinus baikalensis TaxID=2892015 RepID=A0ABS8HZ68_9FIRM|nr:SDR family oxidoreductase [Pelosinus baikalensis]MCC5468456.1 SDR family oxidoreductase [Pelosinus baikalensis]